MFSWIRVISNDVFTYFVYVFQSVQCIHIYQKWRCQLRYLLLGFIHLIYLKFVHYILYAAINVM